MSRFLSKRNENLTPYTPGEQPKTLNVTKLNTNECPFPPSEKALRFAAEHTRPLNLYPELQCIDMRARLAELHGLAPDNFVLGNGSDELLNFAFLAFCDGEKGAAFPNISYGFYPVFADLNHVPYLEIPLREDFSLAPEDYFGLGRLPGYLAAHARYALVTAAACGITWFAASLLPGGGLGGLALRALLCLALPNLIYFLCYWKTAGFRAALPLVRSILTRR